ncbi:FkbM family methyltransferase [Microcoleus sp. T3_B1]|uniref:FkbM family methyltransferase n=1 Tax=Microcoleus sp. T3_B1 TaxID=3055425 RepID=UPI002FD5E57E
MNHQPMNIFLNWTRKFTQFAYQHPPLGYLGELTRKLYPQPTQPVVIDDFDRNLYFTCDLKSYICNEIFWRGFYSYHQCNFLENLLKPEMVFMDVGANHGEFTCFAAKRLTSGSVIAFEPVSTTFEKLSSNVKMNQWNHVQLVQKGLSDRVGKLPIYISMEKEKHYNLHNEGVATIYPDQNYTECLGEIELTTLDRWMEENPQIQRLDVMKIDIEGAELDALKGGEKTLAKFRPLILMEINQKTIRAAGLTSKYLLDYMNNMGYHYELIYRDSLYTKGGQTLKISEDQLSEIDDLIFSPK